MTTETKDDAPANKIEEAEDFAAAFAEAIKEPVSGDPASGKPADEPAAPAADAPAKPAADAAPAKPDAAAKPAADAAAPAKPDDAATKAAAEETARKTAEDNARKLAEDAARKLADEKTAKEAEEKRVRDAAEAADIKDPELPADVKAMLDKFDVDWPEQAKAMRAAVSHAIGGLEAKTARAIKGVVEKIYGDMAPLANTIVETSEVAHHDAIVKGHSDFDQIVPKLGDWIKTQPAYLAKAYQAVYDSGNATEVIDLVSRYKESNGISTQTAAPAPSTPAPAPAAATAATTKAAKEAAAALAPVAASRTAPAPTGVDPNDYDSAWADAVAAEAKAK